MFIARDYIKKKKDVSKNKQVASQVFCEKLL